MKGNILFIHSGGVTPVINAVANAIKNHCTETMYICPFGVSGLINQQWFPSSKWHDWPAIAQSPGSAFGSSRLRVPDVDQDPEFYTNLFSKLAADNIDTFICNGGNNSQHITLHMHRAAQKLGFKLACIGIPKTIDNDIMHTDTCAGFGTTAKYTATSILEASLDLAAMCHSGPRVLIYQAMGRNTGWIAASSSLAKTHAMAGPHLILIPEASFTAEAVIARIKQQLNAHNHATICIAEGVSTFGPTTTPPAHSLANMLADQLDAKIHVVIADYLQRAARHIASGVDIAQCDALSKEALNLAKMGHSGIMTTVIRKSNSPYEWAIGTVSLEKIAGHEKTVPAHYISDDQMYVNEACINYLKPLIQGESYPEYCNGLPKYSDQIYATHQLVKDNS